MNIFLTFYAGEIALIHVQLHFYLLCCHRFVLLKELRAIYVHIVRLREKKIHFELHRAVV